MIYANAFRRFLMSHLYLDPPLPKRFGTMFIKNITPVPIHATLSGFLKGSRVYVLADTLVANLVSTKLHVTFPL